MGGIFILAFILPHPSARRELWTSNDVFAFTERSMRACTTETLFSAPPTLYCTPILLSLRLYSFLWAFKLSFKRETFVRIQIILNKQRAVTRSQFQKWTNSIIWDRDRSEIQWRLRSVYSESVHRLFNDTMYMRYLKSKASRDGGNTYSRRRSTLWRFEDVKKPHPLLLCNRKEASLLCSKSQHWSPSWVTDIESPLSRPISLYYIWCYPPVWA